MLSYASDPDPSAYLDDRQFQLVTWAKDRRLRLWPISDEILKEVGHKKGAKIDIPMTRRGGPDISYRTFSETPAPVVPFSLVSSPPVIPRHLAPGSSLLSASLTASPPTPSLLTSSLLAASFSAGPSPLSQPPPPPREPARTAATMTTTSARNRRQKAHDRLAWMEGVKVLKPPMMGEGDASGDTASKASNAGGTGKEGVESTTHTRSSSLVRGTDAGTAREGGETERAESVMSPGSARTGTAVGREVQHTNLGEEITSVVRRFPRVNFEKVSSRLSSHALSPADRVRASGSCRWKNLHCLSLQPFVPPGDVYLPQELSSLGCPDHRTRA